MSVLLSIKEYLRVGPDITLATMRFVKKILKIDPNQLISFLLPPEKVNVLTSSLSVKIYFLKNIPSTICQSATVGPWTRV